MENLNPAISFAISGDVIVETKIKKYFCFFEDDLKEMNGISKFPVL